jgi:anaerobic magnesium-protoporphyrin IX monomethyl ester cyclase
MARIMLIRDFGPSNIPYLAQALGIIGTMLSEKSHEVTILDNNSNYIRYSTQQILKKIDEFAPDVLGFNINTFNARKTYQLIDLAKKKWPHIPVLAGGIHMKYCHEEAAEHQADVVVVNEAECIIHDLVNAVLGHNGNKASLVNSVKTIPGISYLDENGAYHIGPQETQPVLMNLDEIPFIDYDLFNLNDFIKTKNDSIYLGFIVSQRGCPYPCNFCSESYLIGNIRENSADYIIDYINYLNRKYGVTVVGFGDNNFTLSKKRTTDVCRRIMVDNLNKKFSFYCQTNVKTNVTVDQANMLKKAGFEYVSLGIERLTEDGKKLINKYIPDDKIQEAIKTLRGSGINVNSNLLVGFPWDTKELVLEEQRLFDQAAPSLAQIQSHVIVPMPGTEYYDNYPVVKEWYLDESFFKAYDTYFSQVLVVYLGPDILKLNPFNLPRETINTIKKIYYGSLIKTYLKRTKNFKGRIFFLIPQLLDLTLAALSFTTYKISSKLEAVLFTRLKQLRFLLGTKFAVKKIVEAEWDGESSSPVKGFS